MKLLGGFLVLISSFMTIKSYFRNKKQGYLELIYFAEIMEKSLIYLEGNRLRSTELFYELVRWSKDNAKLQNGQIFIEEIYEGLLKHLEPSGQLIWQRTLEQNREFFHLTREEMEWIAQSKDAFFGDSLEENMRQLHYYSQELRRLAQIRKQEQKEQEKLYYPVGMLGGLMIVILCI